MRAHEAFENETELNKHNEKFEFGCEDCSICFTSKLMYDLHELEKHPDSNYARDIIPQTTKLQFAAGVK